MRRKPDPEVAARLTSVYTEVSSFLALLALSRRTTIRRRELEALQPILPDDGYRALLEAFDYVFEKSLAASELPSSPTLDAFLPILFQSEIPKLPAMLWNQFRLEHRVDWLAVQRSLDMWGVDKELAREVRKLWVAAQYASVDKPKAVTRSDVVYASIEFIAESALESKGLVGPFPRLAAAIASSRARTARKNLMYG